MIGRQKIGITIILLVFFLPLPSIDVVVAAEGSSSSLEVSFQLPELNYSEPISIDGDYDFDVQFGHTGNGTLESPYIIENYSTDLNLTDTDPINPDLPSTVIKIWNTRCHFIVRNCTIRGWARWDFDPIYETPPFDIRGGGIGFHNVANGVVYNNTLILTSGAMGGWDIFNNTFKDNVIVGNPVNGELGNYGCQGIDMDENSVGNIVANNTVQKVAYGVILADAHQNQIENNTFISCDSGIYMLANSSFNKVSFNNCSTNRVGIVLRSSHNNSITNNTCMWNNMTGIVITWDCTNNTLSGNLVAFNGLEYATTSSELSDTMVLAQSARGQGIWIDSNPSRGPNRLNKVVWNDIIGNGVNAKNDEAENSYDLNFWSDYHGTDLNGDNIGDSQYSIDGDAPTSDPHPRMSTRYPNLVNNTIDNLNADGNIPIDVVIALTIVISCVCIVVVFFRRRT